MGYDGELKFNTSVDSTGFQTGINRISTLASGALKTTATIIGGASLAVAGLGTAAIKVGADFESGMSKVQAISNASSTEMQQLTDKAKEMGAKTKFSATESADAFQYMAMAGWQTTDMLDGIEGIMSLAAASGEDLATTSDIVTDALTAFGLSASDSSHFSDVLAQASSSANTNVGMMGETFKYVAPLAGAMGFSIEDTATAIGLMANAGIKSTQAGTSLRSIFTRLAKPTKEVSSAMDTLGISIVNSDGSMKSLDTIMKDLRGSFKGLTAEQKTQMAAAIGGQEAMSGLLAIVNASDEDFDKLTDSIANSDGAAERMAETMMDNLPGAIEQAGGALETLGLTFYEKVQDPLKETIQTITDMVDEMNTAFTEKGFDGLISAFGDSLAELSQMAVDAAPELIDAGVNLVTSFIDSIMDHSDEFASSGAELVTRLAEGILEVTGKMWSAGVELFAKFLSGIADNAPQIVETGKQVIADFGQTLVDNAPSIGSSAAIIISEIATAVIENIPQIIETGKQIVQGFIQGIREEFPGVGAFLDGLFSGLASTLGPAVEGIVSILSGFFSVLDGADPATMEAVGKAIGVIAGSIAMLKVAQTVTGSVQTLFTTLGGFKSGLSGITGIIGKVVEGFALWSGGAGTLGEVIALQFPKIAAFGTKIGSFATSVGSVFSKIASVAGTAFEAISGFISTFGSIIAGVGSVIGGAILAITNFFSMLKDGFSWLKEILMVIGIAIAAVGAVILGAPALVAGIIAGIVAAVATLVVAVKEHWEQIVGFVSSIPERVGAFIDSIVLFFQELPGKIITAISTLAEQFVTWGASMLETASTVVSGIVENIVTFFTELPYKIGYALGFIIGKFIEFGVNAITWITTNVPLIIDSIVTFFTELPGKIGTWLTNTLTNFATWGTQMLQKAIETAQQCVENISTFFSELPGKVQTWLTNTLTNLQNWASDMIQRAGEAATNAVESVSNFFSELPGKVAQWLDDTISRIGQWASDMVAKGRQGASDLVDAVINGVSSLPSQMADIGYNIVSGVWGGICSAAGWFKNQVSSFFSGIVDGAKAALGIHSPSRVFASEVGSWIPPGIGEGIEDKMPNLISDTEDEMARLAKKMQMAVNVETGKMTLDKNTSQTYKIERENGQSFDDSKTEVTINGTIHTQVDLDGEKVGNSQTPIIDKNMGRIDEVKKRGG